jgi:lipoprotein NlpI
VRIDKCSQAIASTELAQSQKRGPFYVRGRAYEQIGSVSDAERDYLAVLSIDPDHAAAKARLEGLHMQAALLAR